jgi:methyl-accepting chemotaxis protein
MREKRTKIWIDRFQTRLFIRIAVYFLLYQAVVGAIFYFGYGFYAAHRQTSNQEVPGFLLLLAGSVMICLAAAFIYDAIKFTHRIVGPLYRIHQLIKTIVAGDHPQPLTLRTGDYLQDLKDDINRMLNILEQQGAIVLKKKEPNIADRTNGQGKTRHEPDRVPALAARCAEDSDHEP